MKLHLFYPENDLALASGKVGYTTPAKVLPLRRAGMLLPLWYGERGDMVCGGGVNAAWFDSMSERFDFGIELFNHCYRSDIEPAPWGWSAASANLLRQQGVPDYALPDKERLEAIRQLSHRRSASLVQSMIAAQLPFPIAQAAVECTSTDALPLLLASGRGFIAKLPWSSSGRGLLDSRKCSPEHFVRQAAGMIHSQGSFMLEEAYDKVVDFAMLFDCRADSCSFRGYSLFNTGAGGRYSGNLLLPDSRIEEILSEYVSSEQLHAVAKALENALAQLCRGVYCGPVGVDMLIARRGVSFLLDATVEINFRMTMGRVALQLRERFLHDEAEAEFRLIHGPAPEDTSVVENHRLCRGTLLLTPPDTEFNYVLSGTCLRRHLREC